MIQIFCGIFAFVLFIFSDLTKLRGKRTLTVLFFALGGIFLIGATFSMFVSADLFAIFEANFLRAAVISLCVAGALGLLIFTLFFALPAVPTYTGTEQLSLVSSGMYALCRHPGVLWLSLFYLLSWFLCRTPVFLCAFFVFSALDTLYVLWQDIDVFPRSIPGYEAYRKTTPFLIPTCASVRSALNRPIHKEDAS